MALAFKKLGSVLQARGDLPAATEYFRKALAMDQERVGAEPGSVQAQRDLSFSIGTLAGALADAGNYAEGLAGYRRALAIRQSLADADPADANARRAVASAHQKLAEIAMSAGSFEESRNHGLSAIRMYQGVSDPQSVAATSFNIAHAYELSAGRIPSGERRTESLAQSRNWYARSLAAWKELEKTRALAPTEKTKPEEALAGMARCEAALAGKRGG